MSSNIRLPKICQNCGNHFIAKTTVTKYCSLNCGRIAYKFRMRNYKIKDAVVKNDDFKALKPQDILIKEILTVKETSILLGCSTRTIYRLINSKKLRAVNISSRLTRVHKTEIYKLLKPPPEKNVVQSYPKNPDFLDCYSYREIYLKYNISPSALQSLIKREMIPKIKKGRYNYLSKRHIDKLLT